jgi:hypothetical protein
LRGSTSRRAASRAWIATRPPPDRSRYPTSKRDHSKYCIAAKFSDDSQRIGQGRENAKAYLKEHPEVAGAIEATIRAQGGLGADAGPGIDLLDEDHEITVD